MSYAVHEISLAEGNLWNSLGVRRKHFLVAAANWTMKQFPRSGDYSQGELCLPVRAT
jgi:hypothetical protein